MWFCIWSIMNNQSITAQLPTFCWGCINWIIMIDAKLQSLLSELMEHTNQSQPKLALLLPRHPVQPRKSHRDLHVLAPHSSNNKDKARSGITVVKLLLTCPWRGTTWCRGTGPSACAASKPPTAAGIGRGSCWAVDLLSVSQAQTSSLSVRCFVIVAE